MAGRASIVGAAVSDVGKVRSHNEDAHYFDAELGVFVVCDGMGGHAAGEVASAIAVKTIRHWWSSNEVLDSAARWLVKGTPEARKQLLDTIRGGVIAAHQAIVEEAKADEAKTGMGTTLVGAMVVGADCVFAHAGDSRAYLVRDGIAMQLTEDHTLMARLMAAGVEVDTTGEGARFKSMLTNALGIGQECKVSTFVVPLADGDRFLLCSDGVSEYIKESEVGEVLTKQPSPARAAQRLVDMALERGGADNATALVVRVLEAGDQPQSARQRTKDDEAIGKCVLLSKLSPQQRLRALRIGLPRDHADGERIPAQTLGDRVAWIIVEGTVEQDGEKVGPGALLYPEALAGDRPLPDRDGLATARSEVRAIALRSDDFREMCEDDDELGEVLLDGLTGALAARLRRSPSRSVVVVQHDIDPRASTDPNIKVRVPMDRGTTEDDVGGVVVVTDKPVVPSFINAPTVPRIPLPRLPSLRAPDAGTAATDPALPTLPALSRASTPPDRPSANRLETSRIPVLQPDSAAPVVAAAVAAAPVVAAAPAPVVQAQVAPAIATGAGPAIATAAVLVPAAEPVAAVVPMIETPAPIVASAAAAPVASVAAAGPAIPAVPKAALPALPALFTIPSPPAIQPPRARTADKITQPRFRHTVPRPITLEPDDEAPEIDPGDAIEIEVDGVDDAGRVDNVPDAVEVASVVADVVAELSDEEDVADRAKTFVGPPPISPTTAGDDDDSARDDGKTQVTRVIRPDSLDDEPLAPPPSSHAEDHGRKPITSEDRVAASGEIELEPEQKFDINPDDVADVARRKRKKRLTEGWDD